MATVDQGERGLGAREGVVHAHRGDDEAEPDQGAADDAVLEVDRAEVTDHAGEHERHDQIGDDGDEKRRGRGVHVLFSLAEGCEPEPAKDHVPGGARAEPGERCNHHGDVVHASESHVCLPPRPRLKPEAAWPGHQACRSYSILWAKRAAPTGGNS